MLLFLWSTDSVWLQIQVFKTPKTAKKNTSSPCLFYLEIYTPYLYVQTTFWNLLDAEKAFQQAHSSFE